MTAFNLVSLLLFNDTIVQGEKLTKVKETKMPRMADAYRPRCSAHHPAVIGDCSPLELARAAPTGKYQTRRHASSSVVLNLAHM